LLYSIVKTCGYFRSSNSDSSYIAVILFGGSSYSLLTRCIYHVYLLHITHCKVSSSCLKKQ